MVVTLPEYRISLGKSAALRQPDANSEHSFGILYFEEITCGNVTNSIDLGKTTGIQKYGQVFEFDGARRFLGVAIWRTVQGTPTDYLTCKLYNSNEEVIAISSQLVGTGSGYGVFEFPYVELEANKEYFFAVERTGAQDDTNYWKIHKDTSSPVTYIEDAIKYESGSWTKISADDCYAYLLFDYFNYSKFGARIRYVGSGSSIRFTSVSFYGHFDGTTRRSIRCEIRNDSGDLLATSQNYYEQDGKWTFYFSDVTLIKNDYYYIICYSDLLEGDPGPFKWPNNRWYGYYSTDPGAGYFGDNNEMYIQRAYKYVGALTYDSNVPKINMTYVIEADDITDYVKQVTINTGKNDVDGQIIVGTCDITLENDDGQFNPDNELSPFYGLFDIMAEIQVFGFYEEYGGPLFTGFIKKITPSPKIGMQVVTVYLEDEFYQFKETEISLGSVPAQIASDTIINVLTAMGLDEVDWDIDDTSQVLLAPVTWNNEKAIECLNKIVEAGQHHHFIDGNGNYVFKSNQWLSGKAPEWYFNEINSGRPRFGWDIASVLNRIKVDYNSMWYTEEDQESQDKYGLKELEVDNELTPSGLYATFVARYILNNFSFPGFKLEFTLDELYPEIFALEIGTVIQYTNTLLNLNEKYIVMGLTHDFDVSKRHSLTVQCRKYTKPILEQLAEHSPIVGNKWIKFASTVEYGSMSWALGLDEAVPYSVDFELKHSLDNDTYITVSIYDTDSNSLPTGDPLCISQPTLIPYAASSGTYTFLFPAASRIEVEQDKEYAFVIDLPFSEEFFKPFDYPDNFIDFTESDNDIKAFGQSFQIPSTTQVDGIAVYLKWNTKRTLNFATYVEIYAADGSGHPTGGVLATSDIINLSSFGEGKKIYTFSSPPTLTGATSYCWKLCEAYASDDIVNFNTDQSNLRQTGGRQPPGFPNDAKCGQMFKDSRDIINPTIALKGYLVTTGIAQTLNYKIYTTSGGLPNTVHASGTVDIPPNIQTTLFYKFTTTLTANTLYAIILETFDLTWPERYYSLGSPYNKYVDGKLVLYRDGAWIADDYYDIASYLIAEKYSNQWSVQGLATNPYADGLAWKQKNSDSSYVDITDTDFWFALLEDEENRWEAWGQVDDPTTPGTPGEKISDTWYNKYPTILDPCDTADWTEDARATAEVVNNTDFVFGGSSLDLGKNGTTALQFGYTKSITSADPDGKNAGCWLKFKTAAYNVMKTSGECLRIRLNTSSGNYYYKSYTKADLTADIWERFGDDFLSGWTSVGTPDPNDITQLQIIMYTQNASDTITSGDILMDHWEFHGDYDAYGFEFLLKYY
jgi:hypothetical protein